MFLLNKKRIIFISLSIVFSILYSSIFDFLKKDTIYTSSTPISNRTVILDAGHGIPDGGATNSNGEILEATLNLQLALKLQNLLESSNCNVILTRSDENGIFEADSNSIKEKKISDMKNRAKIANSSNAEIFVSIHMNKLNETKYSGWQTFYKNKDDKSKKLAQSIQSSLNSFMKKENSRQIKSISNIYLSKHVQIPFVVVECGFLSNPDEAILLSKEEYQDNLAWSIYIGIMDYFNDWL